MSHSVSHLRSTLEISHHIYTCSRHGCALKSVTTAPNRAIREVYAAAN